MPQIPENASFCLPPQASHPYPLRPLFGSQNWRSWWGCWASIPAIAVVCSADLVEDLKREEVVESGCGPLWLQDAQETLQLVEIVSGVDAPSWSRGFRLCGALIHDDTLKPSTWLRDGHRWSFSVSPSVSSIMVTLGMEKLPCMCH
jgi:hypothetical protein